MRSQHVSEGLRGAVAARAGGGCEYCRVPESHAPQRLSIEHIDPQDRGGETRLENLAFACQGCNSHKYTHTEATDPIGGDVVPLFHPRLQQ